MSNKIVIDDWSDLYGVNDGYGYEAPVESTVVDDDIFDAEPQISVRVNQRQLIRNFPTENFDDFSAAAQEKLRKEQEEYDMEILRQQALEEEQMKKAQAEIADEITVEKALSEPVEPEKIEEAEATLYEIEEKEVEQYGKAQVIETPDYENEIAVIIERYSEITDIDVDFQQNAPVDVNSVEIETVTGYVDFDRVIAIIRKYKKYINGINISFKSEEKEDEPAKESVESVDEISKETVASDSAPANELESELATKKPAKKTLKRATDKKKTKKK